MQLKVHAASPEDLGSVPSTAPGGSLLPVASAPGDPVFSYDFIGYYTHMNKPPHTYTHN